MVHCSIPVIAAGVLGLAAGASALTPAQVLVVYNSQGPDGSGNGVADSLDVFNAYAAARPGVLGFNLNDPTLAPGTISYADFESKVRNPLRNFLSANNLTSQVVALTLTKGLPHRIDDTDNAGIGDSPAGTEAEFFTGKDATFASVDSELTLLWQNLRSGEAGGAFDSLADNLIANPYAGSTQRVANFSRNNIANAKAWGALNANINNVNQQIGFFFQDNANTVADGGDIYLVTRLDGDSVADVTASIQRGINININPATDRVVIDENSAAGNFDGNDYSTTANTLANGGFVVTYDSGATFHVGANAPVLDPGRITGPVAALVTYGGNHSNASQDEYVFTWQGQLVNGAILNSMESYNGRPLGGLPEFGDQGSVAEWLAAGGTLATGNVWEPFAFSVATSNTLLDRFLLDGWTWAEAAYAALPFLSWQQVVIGDPLATIPEPGATALLALALPALLRRRR